LRGEDMNFLAKFKKKYRMCAMHIAPVIIDSTTHDQRFDRFLRKFFKSQENVTLADIYRMIRYGEIRINSKKAKEEYRLKDDDMITFNEDITFSSKKKISRIERIDLDMVKRWILYEDEYWVIFNKPSGISVQP
jgi:23S rRNA pseudouridine955/2504/2580 synthase